MHEKEIKETIVSINEYLKIKKISYQTLKKLIKEGKVNTTPTTKRTAKGKRIIKGIKVPTDEYIEFLRRQPVDYISIEIPDFVDPIEINKTITMVNERFIERTKMSKHTKKILVSREAIEKVNEICSNLLPLHKHIAFWKKILFIESILRRIA